MVLNIRQFEQFCEHLPILWPAVLTNPSQRIEQGPCFMVKETTPYGIQQHPCEHLPILWPAILTNPSQRIEQGPCFTVKETTCNGI